MRLRAGLAGARDLLHLKLGYGPFCPFSSSNREYAPRSRGRVEPPSIWTDLLKITLRCPEFIRTASPICARIPELPLVEWAVRGDSARDELW
jgi:hypothetical protein